MNPIGLTRAEEEKERPTAAPAQQPPAPSGVPSCIATVMPDGKVCGTTATGLVVWPDREAAKSPMCTDCANRFAAIARSHGSSIGFEPFTKPPAKR